MDIEEKITNAIRTTLVIENKQSVHIAVEKIMNIVNDPKNKSTDTLTKSEKINI